MNPGPPVRQSDGSLSYRVKARTKNGDAPIVLAAVVDAKKNDRGLPKHAFVL